jgi:hypothetical protein
MADFTPPAPGTTGSSANTREFDNQIPATARETDPLVKTHAGIDVKKLRADFKPEQFTRALQQHGKRVVWRKAMVCPCLNPVTGQAKVDCPNCDNSGFIYVDRMEIRALMLSFDKTTRIYEKFGMWISGEVQVTVEQAYRMVYRDSIEMVDDLMGFNEVIKKGDRHGRRSVLEAGVDTARYRIQNLNKVLICDADDNVIPLEIGYHLELNEHGQIVWRAPGNKLVNDGQTLSLHYDFHPVYIVISHPHVLRSDIVGTKQPAEVVSGLPLQMGAQLDFLSNDNPNVHLPVTGDC